MDEIGYGLLDRTMIQRLRERSGSGGIGIIIAQLSAAVPLSVQEAMAGWVMQQRGLVWRYRMENDYFFFLQRGGKSEEKLDKLLRSSVDSLQSKLLRGYEGYEDFGGTGTKFSIGFAAAVPSTNGRSAEATIYKGIREAVTMMLNQQLRNAAIEQAAAAIEQDAFASGGKDTDQQEWNWGSGSKGLPNVSPAPFLIGALAKPIPTFSPTSLVSDLARMFEINTHVQGAVIASEGRPLGLVMKENMNQLLAGQFGLPLYWNRSITKIMDEETLVVDANLTVEQVAQQAMARDISRLYHVVIITRHEKLIGAASIRSILECMTQLRTEEARTANPLTGLPGNATIQREMQRRIDSGKPFSIVYGDLDYFKWYNDCFGFSQGDELIRYLATVLQDVTRHVGEKQDFVGHIGGDDFIVLSHTSEPEKLCKYIIARFDGGISAYHQGGKAGTTVMDRSGKAVEQDGVTLSLSLLQWDGEHEVTTAMISQAAARLKKQAKAVSGSAFVAADVPEKHPGEGIT
ncbi:diguanylate cyclase (GGDEF)-like protein [Paenibacillus taihuensis]|uniref:Diguanylate cyclase (GGDEF)-like protein n=1 Tax=Paenibacillus taihuensis TaxID=1156355 RepID=A0A3D9RSE1_9BACL|nr:GGDEF domain-containing protein [Paenibacillus taihuensis]REE78884.1 diguanylate cyclase (GGDEF)-like protein [Paenibacillus taihuensis]